MKDYFRQESIAFHYMPLLYLARIFFVALMLISGNIQWCVMLLGIMFSLGLNYSTEEEYLLPLTDEEYKKRRLCRVLMIWLRYLILGTGGYIMMYVLSSFDNIRRIISIRPAFAIVFFVFQMLLVFEVLLEGVTGKGIRLSILETVLRHIHMIIFFAYGISYVRGSDTGLIFAGNEILHIVIMSAAIILIIFNCIKMLHTWKVEDYAPESEKLFAGGKKA